MRTIAFLFNDDGCRLATLSLSSADFSVLFNGPTWRVNARLGNLTLEDDTVESSDTKFRRLVEIQGDDLANFQYETFLQGTTLTLFNAVMDAASEAARQQATELSQTSTKMHYDVLIRTPIIIFPLDGNSTDSLIAYLGEINASNSFSEDQGNLVTTTKAGLHNIRLTSELSHEGKSNTLEILGDVNIDVIMTTFSIVERSPDCLLIPDSDIVSHMSDVKINLTQPQYFALLALASSIPKILDLSELNEQPRRPKPRSNLESHFSHPDSRSQLSSKPHLMQHDSQTSSISNRAAAAVWAVMELAFTVTNVTLELFDATIAPTESELNSLARFSLNGIPRLLEVKIRWIDDGRNGFESSTNGRHTCLEGYPVS
ncbi:hypothetical protein PCASD_23287 [Puccinia coronata f. sp. avenae]|uniref:Uncharacterized protein n=1 Tax=Puccinia coronata f. sp. avenae TaxID=200324 RepID=A0A2N5THM3_9BASI|nr:hypothetical protein PCASD_23287 [Puccinia coronata f. sp. avenae]